MQVQGQKTYAGTARSAAYHHFTGKDCLDVHLLKPSRLEVILGQPDVVCADDAPQGPAQAWLKYLFPTRFSAGCLQNSPRGSAKTLGRS